MIWVITPGLASGRMTRRKLPEKLTLPLSIANFVGQHTTNYPVLFAALTIVTLPVVITYVLAQKGFIEGVSAIMAASSSSFGREIKKERMINTPMAMDWPT